MKQLPSMIGDEIKGAVPGLASGGVVTSPTLAAVGEAGPEAVIPLDRLESMMGGGGGGQTTVSLSGGLDAFVENISRDQNVDL